MTRVIRPAREGDAPALAELHASSFDVGWSVSDFSQWLSRPGAFAVVADEGGATVAIGLALTAGDDAELLTIATASQARRRGLGAAVFGALNAAAAGRGLARWVLEVARNNQPALRLYESEGFVEIAVRPGYYRQAGGHVDALVLARAVNLDKSPAGRHRDV